MYTNSISTISIILKFMFNICQKISNNCPKQLNNFLLGTFWNSCLLKVYKGWKNWKFWYTIFLVSLAETFGACLYHCGEETYNSWHFFQELWIKLNRIPEMSFFSYSLHMPGKYKLSIRSFWEYCYQSFSRTFRAPQKDAWCIISTRFK